MDESPEFAASEPVDLDRIEAITGGDKALAKSIVDVFIKDTQKRIALLRTALETYDAAAVKAQSHSIKGASSNVGATQMAALAYTLEQIGARQALPEAVEPLEALSAEFIRVRDALLRHVGDENPPQA